MDVDLLFYRKNIEPDGNIIEMKIWKVPHSKDKPHRLKYSLAFIREGKRVVGYDNAEMRGDHKHYKDTVSSYYFEDIETLIKDFYGDVEKIKRG
ncbi:MAG: hypothetical protein HZA10_03885 [Nitrospirae bacterium]|nr:hypothetical protein [Nitrospirota bacterium]